MSVDGIPFCTMKDCKTMEDVISIMYDKCDFGFLFKPEETNMEKVENMEPYQWQAMLEALRDCKFNENPRFFTKWYPSVHKKIIVPQRILERKWILQFLLFIGPTEDAPKNL